MNKNVQTNSGNFMLAKTTYNFNQLMSIEKENCKNVYGNSYIKKT